MQFISGGGLPVAIFIPSGGCIGITLRSGIFWADEFPCGLDGVLTKRTDAPNDEKNREHTTADDANEQNPDNTA